MPLTSFQSAVLNVLAASRSPDSYIAGGIAINRNGPRISNDIDIFHDSESRLDAAVAADEAALGGGGYTVTWPPGQRTGKRAAIVEKDGERVLLEWVTDAQFRFFPTQKDSLFGYVLHPADLAANKAAAAADRRVPRDIVDLVTIHQTILPLGAVVAAAVGKFPVTTARPAPSRRRRCQHPAQAARYLARRLGARVLHLRDRFGRRGSCVPVGKMHPVHVINKTLRQHPFGEQ